MAQAAASWLGIARSLAMYYAVPLRSARMTRLYSQFVSPDALCFDIGAHAGNRVRCWRRLGARVIAVEPQAPFSRLLQRLYGHDANVVIATCALGRAPGRARLLVSPRAPTVTTLSREWIEGVRNDPSFSRVRWSEGEDVAVTTLDALIGEHGMPQFVKIDVEGFEAEVLAGLNCPLPALSFEYLAAARGVALDCVDRLCELGRYRFNWSAGESQRLGARAWLDASGIRAFLRSLSSRAGSGDVYARLSHLEP
jgi:FkbM family methyltransferase